MASAKLKIYLHFFFFTLLQLISYTSGVVSCHSHQYDSKVASILQISRKRLIILPPPLRVVQMVTPNG